MPCDDEGRDWDYAAAYQAIPKIASKQPEARNSQSISLQVSEGTRSCLFLDFGLLTSRAVRQYISIILRDPIYCTLL